MTPDDPLKPSPMLLAKLGSVVVHAQEYFSPSGHAFDRTALEQCANDPDVVEWVKAMDMLAMVPKKRR